MSWLDGTDLLGAPLHAAVSPQGAITAGQRAIAAGQRAVVTARGRSAGTAIGKRAMQLGQQAIAAGQHLAAVQRVARVVPPKKTARHPAAVRNVARRSVVGDIWATAAAPKTTPSKTSYTPIGPGDRAYSKQVDVSILASQAAAWADLAFLVAQVQTQADATKQAGDAAQKAGAKDVGQKAIDLAGAGLARIAQSSSAFWGPEFTEVLADFKSWVATWTADTQKAIADVQAAQSAPVTPPPSDSIQPTEAQSAQATSVQPTGPMASPMSSSYTAASAAASPAGQNYTDEDTSDSAYAEEAAPDEDADDGVDWGEDIDRDGLADVDR